MNSPPEPSEVFIDLGDKFLEAVSLAVGHTERDLRSYRRGHPLIVAGHSQRGLASWIHDRLWVNLAALLEGVPDVSIRDAEPNREIFVGLKYQVRLKRHNLQGGVTTYPTRTALSFLRQRQQTLDGVDQVSICAGYYWEAETRSIGEPVISLPKDRSRAVWCEVLASAEEGESGLFVLQPPPQRRPVPPMIDFPADDRSGVQEDG